MQTLGVNDAHPSQPDDLRQRRYPFRGGRGEGRGSPARRRNPPQAPQKRRSRLMARSMPGELFMVGKWLDESTGQREREPHSPAASRSDGRRRVRRKADFSLGVSQSCGRSRFSGPSVTGRRNIFLRQRRAFAKEIHDSSARPETPATRASTAAAVFVQQHLLVLDPLAPRPLRDVVINLVPKIAVERRLVEPFQFLFVLRAVDHVCHVRGISPVVSIVSGDRRRLRRSNGELSE